MKKPVIASSSTLGTNCWKAERFCGGECPKVVSCFYPEKKTCNAHINKVKVIRVPYTILAKEADNERDYTD